jgi:hypothetical protein
MRVNLPRKLSFRSQYLFEGAAGESYQVTIVAGIPYSIIKCMEKYAFIKNQ